MWTIVLMLSLLLVPAVPQQTTKPDDKAAREFMERARYAIKEGTASDVTRLCAKNVELGFDGDKRQYSLPQAENALRSFFRKYPPADFECMHQGASRVGHQYCIGKYMSDKANFTVYLLVKEVQGERRIDNINFARQE